MVCKIFICCGFPDIPDKAGRKTRSSRKRKRAQAIAKRNAFHGNAIERMLELSKANRQKSLLNILFTNFCTVAICNKRSILQ